MREVGLAMLVAAVLWAARGWRAGRAPAVLTLGAAGALLAAAGTALLGHPMGGAPATVLIGAVHVLAAGGWAGSVLVAALVALMPGGSVGQVRELLRAFAALAVTCVAALTVTGLLMTGAQVSTVDALLTTPYGLILLAKVTAVAAAGLLGLRTARRLRRSDGGLLPRAGLLVEAAALAAVLALAGTLAASGPARGPRFPVATPVTAQPQVSGQAADLLDTLRIRPNRPGRNVLTITVSDTRRPAPAPISGVSVSLAGPDGARRVHPVTRTPEGWTVTLDEIRTPGEWQVAVTVMRDGLAPVTDTHRWAVPAAPATVAVSAAPLQPAIGVLAALVAFGAVAASIVYGRRRWRRRGTAAAERRPAVSAEESERVPIEV
jgi:copper transport protein